MPNIGHVGESDPSSESLNTYLDRINEYWSNGSQERSVNSEMLNVINARERDIYPKFVKVKNYNYFKRRMKMKVIVKGQFMLCQIQ